MYWRLVGLGVFALVTSAAAVAGVAVAWRAVPYLLSERYSGDPTQWFLLGIPALIGLWFGAALPALAAFLIRLSWVREVRALRRAGRIPAPRARWTLRSVQDTDTPEENGRRLELVRDGRRVAESSDFVADGPGPRFRGDGRELGLRGGARRLEITDLRTGNVRGTVALVHRVWSGYHRAELDGRVLLAPVGRLSSRWGLVDDTGHRCAVLFPGSGKVDAELSADLDPVTLAAVLWFFAVDRRIAAEDNYWRG